MATWKWGLVLGVMVAALACADPDAGEPAPLIQVSPDLDFAGPADHEGFIIESDGPNDRAKTPMVDSQMWPHEIGVIDPCACSTSACLDSWVNHNLGCNVCVVLYCGDHPARHVCSDCSGAAAR